FWILAGLVPLIILAAPLVQRTFSRSQTVAYVLVDKTGRYAQQIDQRLELDYQRQVLVDLLAYTQEWRAESAVTGAGAAPQPGSPLSDAAVQNFVAAGGAPALLRLLRPKLLPSAPPFRAPPPPFIEIPPPAGVATDSADRFGASIGQHLQKSV